MKFSFAKNLIFLLFLLMVAECLSASGKVSVYVSAHPDDWQLFMGVNAYDDIAASSDSERVLIIYVTAGDYSDNAQQALPYYLAREQGANNSVELAAKSHKKYFNWKNDTATINGHSIIRSSYQFITCYFLRLADGGSEAERNISLKHFRENKFTNNYSIDSLTNYKDWNDLFSTCERILLNEIEHAEEISLHFPDTSQRFNPGDHSDHYESGILFAGALKTIEVKRFFHEGYNSGRTYRHANVKETDIIKESSLFAAYNQAMVDNGYPSIWNNDYIRFCDNNYFRIVTGEEKTNTVSKEIAIAIFTLLVLAISLLTLFVLKRK